MPGFRDGFREQEKAIIELRSRFAPGVELRVNRVDQRLGGLLDVLDEFFQHGLCSSYANLMILSLGGAGAGGRVREQMPEFLKEGGAI